MDLGFVGLLGFAAGIISTFAAEHRFGGRLAGERGEGLCD
jgi:hypothetical protein